MRTLFVAVFAISSISLSAQDLKSGGVLKPEQAIMDIRHYTVALDVDPVNKSINGYTEIDLKLLKPSGNLLFDFWHGLRSMDFGSTEKCIPSRILMMITSGFPWYRNYRQEM